MINNAKGYDEVFAKYERGEWDILRVHEFVRMYQMKLDERKITSQSPQQVVLGTLILWLGWLMFNGGSSLKIAGASGLDAQLAMVNTILAPSAAGIFTFMVKKYISGDRMMWNSIINIRMDFQGLTNGILAGLVSITAGCNCVEPWAAIVIGIMGSIVYSLNVRLLNKLRIDDPLEAFQVHGACGFWGCIAVALFKKNDGVFYGGEDAGKLLGVQIYGCLAIIAWVTATSLIFLCIVKSLGILRLSKQDEVLGGDLHYFGPIEFEGQISEYDLPGIMHK